MKVPRWLAEHGTEMTDIDVPLNADCWYAHSGIILATVSIIDRSSFSLSNVIY